MPKAKTPCIVKIPARTLPVVVGGGTAGLIAAIAAARTGAHTVLIERLGCLGGALTGMHA